MSWFQRKKKGILTSKGGQNDSPAGQWAKCPACNEILSRRALKDNWNVCPKCSHHHPLDSRSYLNMLFQEGPVEMHDAGIKSVDPLRFEDRKKYAVRLRDARRKSAANDAVHSATGSIGPHRLSAVAMDFSFIGGSMGSVVGEVISRAVKRACEERIGLVIISQSGGARMMEGAFSLMQMAKTSAQLTRLSRLNIPYISVMSNPTTGGVTASFAMLGDFNLAEPGALIGFAGPRVIRETIGQDLPSDFQRAEFVLEHGFLDAIVDRRELRPYLHRLLDLLAEPAA